jgi:hypothetical protein|tara:strand:+ start:918 stop:1169 length:252 start_codon:yes stop_codon:yes gene_type:complete
VDLLLNYSKEFIMNLIGQKVEANWGAMYPIAEGVVCGHFGKDNVIIRWEDGTKSELDANSIHELGYRSVNGSPIGVFFGEVAA